MSKLFSVLFLATILTACGNGNNDQPAATTYGYNQNGIASQGGTCPGPVVMDWIQLVASSCGSRNGQPVNGACSRGIDEFRRRDEQYLQGVGCSIPVAQMQWCPNGMNGQATFQLNDAVLQGISTQNGPGTFPLNGQQGPYNAVPGQVGVGQPNGF